MEWAFIYIKNHIVQALSSTDTNVLFKEALVIVVFHTDTQSIYKDYIQI